ncbi:hypothetical protein VTI74DRAFT_7566 [Chaetomium olivicolor]
MALPTGGGDEYPPFRSSGGPYYSAKRRTGDAVGDDQYLYSRPKRPRCKPCSQFAEPVAFRAVDEPPLSYPLLHQTHPHNRYHSPLPHLSSPEPTGTAAQAMERTASGHSICSDPTERCGSTELLEDHEAAQRVRDHLAAFRRRNPDSKHERILRSIINPRRRHHHHHHHHHHSHQVHGVEKDEYPLDNEALESIFSAANEIFFNGRLTRRVTWDWSHSSSSRYDNRVIGTTALRRAAAHTRGFETLIVLSSTILRDPRYSRRLLISTFLHELIHCYLFICCGFRARSWGGHTPGFRDIAAVIDEWVGEESGLYLSRIEADLELFTTGKGAQDGCCGRGDDGVMVKERKVEMGTVNVYPCSGIAVEQEYVAPPAGFVGADSAQEVVYFGSGPSSNTRTGTPTQELVYFANGISSARTGTPTQEMPPHYGSRPASPVNGNIAWRRQRRPLRPLYVYTGDELALSYVYADPVWQRP